MKFLKKLFFVLISSSEQSRRDWEKLTDEELVGKIVVANNTLLFGVLYDRYSKKVYNKCYSFAKDKQEAEDLTQDVFLKLFIQLHSFKEKSKFSTWLYSFTYNFCVNYVNRDRQRKLDGKSDSIEDHNFHLSTLEDIAEEDLFELKISKLKIALNKIDPEDKAILLLKYQDDVSVKELQTLLNIKESAVKMRLKRARLRLVEEHDQI